MSRSSPETERVRHQVASAIDSLTVAALADVFNPRTSSLSKSYSEQIVDILMPRLSGLAPDQSLSALVKQYAIDLRRNASGGDDYPYEYAKATADYLEELIKRAKGNCTCAQAGFPDSCDNCDGLAPTPANTASLDALYECVRDASTENGEMSDFISTDEMIAISEAVLQKFHVIPRVSDTSTARKPEPLALVQPHPYVPGASYFQGDCAVCGHVSDVPWHAISPPDCEGKNHV